MATSNLFTGVQGNTVLRGGGFSIGGGLGGGGYQQYPTSVEDLELNRIKAQALAQQKAQEKQFQDAAAQRSFTATENAAQRALQANLQAGNLSFQGQQALDDRALRERLASGEQAFKLQSQQSQQGFQSGESAADRVFQGAQNDADRYFQGQQTDKQFAFQGSQNDADRQQALGLANIGAETTRRGQDIGLQTARLPFEYKREVLGQFQPKINDTFDSINRGATDLLGYLTGVGGSNLEAPALPGSQVYTDQQTQQRVNAARASGDATAAEQIRNAQRQTAAQGFGSKSPLLAALQAQIQTGAAASNADQEREIRLNSALANADQGVKVGALANQRYATQNEGDIERRRIAVSARQGDAANQISLLASLLGLA